MALLPGACAGWCLQRKRLARGRARLKGAGTRSSHVSDLLCPLMHHIYSRNSVSRKLAAERGIPMIHAVQRGHQRVAPVMISNLTLRGEIMTLRIRRRVLGMRSPHDTRG